MKNYGVCIRNTKDCIEGELDEIYYCEICQAKFVNKMRSISESNNQTPHENKRLLNSIPFELREEILVDAVNKYRISIKSKDELRKHLIEKYKYPLPVATFNDLTSDLNLKKYNLKWKYKEEKKYS